MKFASWAFDGSQVDIVVDESETGAKGDIYKNNTEWELFSVKAERIEVSVCFWTCSSDISAQHKQYKHVKYLRTRHT